MADAPSLSIQSICSRRIEVEVELAANYAATICPCASRKLRKCLAHVQCRMKQYLVVVDHVDVMRWVVVRSFLANPMPRLWASSHMQNANIFRRRYLFPHCMESNKTKFCRLPEACSIDREAQNCRTRLGRSGKIRRSRPPPKLRKFAPIATTTPSPASGTQKRYLMPLPDWESNPGLPR